MSLGPVRDRSRSGDHPAPSRWFLVWNLDLRVRSPSPLPIRKVAEFVHLSISVPGGGIVDADFGDAALDGVLELVGVRTAEDDSEPRLYAGPLADRTLAGGIGDD